MARDKTLIKRQETLDFIRFYRGKYNMSPTLAEIAAHVYGDERNAGNLLQGVIRPLIEEGFLYSAKKGASAIMLTSPQPREVYYQREEREAVK